VLNYIKPYHFPTAYPLALKNLVGSIKAESYIHPRKIVIYDFLKGISPDYLSTTMMRHIGNALGQLHKIQQPNFTLPEFAMGIAEMEPFLKEDVPKCSTEIQNDDFIK